MFAVLPLHFGTNNLFRALISIELTVKALAPHWPGILSPVLPPPRDTRSNSPAAGLGLAEAIAAISAVTIGGDEDKSEEAKGGDPKSEAKGTE